MQGGEQADADPKWHPAPPPGAPPVRAGSWKGQAGGLQGCSPAGAGRGGHTCRDPVGLAAGTGPRWRAGGRGHYYRPQSWGCKRLGETRCRIQRKGFCLSIKCLKVRARVFRLTSS